MASDFVYHVKVTALLNKKRLRLMISYPKFVCIKPFVLIMNSVVLKLLSGVGVGGVGKRELKINRHRRYYLIH